MTAPVLVTSAPRYPGKVCAKMLEKLFRAVLEKKMEKRQCRFRPGRFAVDQLLTLNEAKPILKRTVCVPIFVYSHEVRAKTERTRSQGEMRFFRSKAEVTRLEWYGNTVIRRELKANPPHRVIYAPMIRTRAEATRKTFRDPLVARGRGSSGGWILPNNWTVCSQSQRVISVGGRHTHSQ